MSSFVNDAASLSTELEEQFSSISLVQNGENDVAILTSSSAVEESFTAPTKIVAIYPELSTAGVTLVSTVDMLEQFKLVVAGKTMLAIDAEGVDLSRVGEMTVFSIGVQVNSGVHVFLFDTISNDADLQTGQIAVLKEILENDQIEKIIHDCKQDSDSLYHQLSIMLTNVFDTSAFANKIEIASKLMNLNTTLRNYGCELNEKRNEISDMYRTNPYIWRTRPLTPFLIQYASKDVASLFMLREKLLQAIVLQERRRPNLERECYEASAAAIDTFRCLPCHEIVIVPSAKRGLVIGKNGSNVTQIEQQTGTYVSACGIGGGFLLLAPSMISMNNAKQAIQKAANKTFRRSYSYDDDY